MSSLWLNTRHQFVFNHLPKNAGSSIRGHHKGAKGLFPKDEWVGPCFDDPPDDWPMERSFCILRDPVARFRSGHRYACPQLTEREALAIALDESIDPNDLNSSLGHIRHHLIPQSHPANRLHETRLRADFANLVPSLRCIFAWLGIDPELAERIPHINASR